MLADRIVRVRPTGFVLLIAGDAPRSRRAIDNLRRIADACCPGLDPVAVIDGLKHPELIAEYDVVTVPVLLYLADGQPVPERLYGDLSDGDRVPRFLRAIHEPLPCRASGQVHFHLQPGAA